MRPGLVQQSVVEPNCEGDKEKKKKRRSNRRSKQSTPPPPTSGFCFSWLFGEF